MAQAGAADGAPQLVQFPAGLSFLAPQDVQNTGRASPPEAGLPHAAQNLSPGVSAFRQLWQFVVCVWRATPAALTTLCSACNAMSVITSSLW
jgi:hypothetical protein